MIKTKKKINFIDLIRPNTSIPWDIQFEVYRWMFETAISDRYVTWGYGSDALALLDCRPTCLNILSTDLEGFKKNWKERLNRTFTHVLLDKHARPGAKLWKSDYKIDINESRIIPMKYRDGGEAVYRVGFRCAIDAIFDFAGKSTRESHNASHPNARFVTKANLKCVLKPDGVHWLYALNYGYEASDRTCWSIDLVSDRDETFLDFLHRARLWAEEITVSEVQKTQVVN